jgi:hypothetical protein
MRKSWRGVLGVCVAGAFLGCGSDAPATAAMTADLACQDVASARCARLDACGTNTVHLRFGDSATCVSRQKMSCLEGLSATSTGATPDTVEACAKALPSVTCNDLFNNTVSSTCQAQIGKLGTGEACVFNGQCRSQFCATAKNALCGECMAQPEGGDSCASLTSCGPGLKCVNQGTVCASEVTQTGDACDRDDPCGSGFSCVGARPAAMMQGTCQPAVTLAGASCDPLHQTGSGCDPNLGLVCDVASSVCVAVTVVDAGRACDATAIVCSASGTCVIPTGASLGTCVAAAADGAVCDTSLGPDCMNLSRCVVMGTSTVGTCTLPSDAECH